MFPPSLFSFLKWDVNKILNYFKVLVTEKLAILGPKRNKKITSHVLKSISFQLFSKALGKEDENKTMFKNKKKIFEGRILPAWGEKS